MTIEELNVRIPKPFVEEFLKDPTDCRTKYMCEPPPQIGGWFEIPHKLDECVDRNLPGLVATSQLVSRTVREMDFEYVSMLVDQVPPRVEGAEYYLHGDPGLLNDAFSVCVLHSLPEEKWVVDMESGEERKLKKVVVDFFLNWEPTSTTPVDLKNVEETIEKFAKYYGIQRITFDRWNSATSIQNLIEKGFFAEDLSFSASQQLQMYRNFKRLICNSLITWPDDADLLNELKFLKVVNGKITHDAYGKDRADAIAAAAWSATGEQLSLTQRLVMETIGDFAQNRNANGGAG